MIKYVTFDHFMRWVMNQGTTLQSEIERLLGEDEPTAEYTVYWPKDSIRVIPGSSYAVARTVLAVLQDPRTTWMGAPTSTMPAELALIRRPLPDGFNYWATHAQVGNSKVYLRDHILPSDISGDLGNFDIEQGDPDVVYHLDLTTLPQL